MKYSLDPLTIFSHASVVVKLVMIVLLLLSLATVAAIIYKILEFSLATWRAEEFMEDLSEAEDLKSLYRHWKKKKSIPQVHAFSTFFTKAVREYELKGKLERERLEEVSADALVEVRERLSRFLTFLATTASSAPFIGLFGTVWGIMDAFFRIGQMKSVGLPVVAPAIAEALIATAMGLMAAIPAAVGYNYFLSWQKKIITRCRVAVEKTAKKIDRSILRLEGEGS